MPSDVDDPLPKNQDEEYHADETSSKKSAALNEKSREARCRFCLNVKTQVRGLSKHVQKFHKDFYRFRRNPIEYAASESQIIPADPKYRETTSKPI